MRTPNKPSVLGSVLRAVRANEKTTQREFAKELGISQSCLSEVESGFRLMPDKALPNLQKKFGIDCVCVRIMEKHSNLRYKKQYTYVNRDAWYDSLNSYYDLYNLRGM